VNLRSRVRIIDEKEKIYHVDWSPDSQFLAFSRGPDSGGDSSKPGTHLAAAEIHGVYAKGWNIAVVKTDRAANLHLDKATKADYFELTTNGLGNKEPAWFRSRRKSSVGDHCAGRAELLPIPGERLLAEPKRPRLRVSGSPTPTLSPRRLTAADAIVRKELRGLQHEWLFLFLVDFHYQQIKGPRGRALTWSGKLGRWLQPRFWFSFRKQTKVGDYQSTGRCSPSPGGRGQG
jgi:hypothetical protein